jgi:CMP-N-acetylneuraminic acid synthetase
VWKYAQAETGADVVVDIDVTRPLTLAEDVDGCIASLAKAAPDGTDAVMAICRAKKHPAFDIVESHQWGLARSVASYEFMVRQQLPPAYYHGGVYALTAEALRERASFWSCLVKGYDIEPERAYDIDSETDWRIVEMLMADRLQVA